MAKLKCSTCGRAFVGDGRRRYCEKHQPAKRVRKPRSQHLHAIEPGEIPPERDRPTTIQAAAEAGSTIDELRLMRVRIAKALDSPNCPPKDIAALSRRQIEIAREIDAIRAREAEAADGEEVSDAAFDASAV